MTVPVQTPYTYSTANGVTTVFPYGFKIAAEEDLVVTIDDVIQVSGYTVSGVGSPTGGNVAFTSPPANGAVVGRYLDPVLKRDTDYQQFGDWRSSVVNLDFDRIWIALQTIKQNALRAIKLRVDTSEDQVITEQPADRALKVIGFDALGKLKLYIAQAGTSLVDLGNNIDMSQGVALVGGAGRVVGTIAALKALPKNGSQRAHVLGYYSAGDGGGGAYWYDSTDTTSADNGGTIIVAADGGRWKLASTSVLSVKQFGAYSDGTHAAETYTAIQAAITYCQDTLKALYFPSSDPSDVYAVNATLTVTKPIVIYGDGSRNVTIAGSGFAAGQYLIDINGTAFGTFEQARVSGLMLMPGAGAHCMRIKDASNSIFSDIGLRTCDKGIVYTGTRCFSNTFERVYAYAAMTGIAFHFDAHTGGGQHSFRECSFGGSTGFSLSSTTATDNIVFYDTNFEQATTNSVYVGGSVAGLSFFGCRTEGCNGVDYLINPTAGNKVTGLVVHGCTFSASDAGGSSRIQLAGAGGIVRGFDITGNTVTHGGNNFSAYLVYLNGDGESGVIANNYLDGLIANCSPVNVVRTNVLVFNNEGNNGKFSGAVPVETIGTWVPTDNSGAGLTFTANGGTWNKVGTMLFYQGTVVYPATASGAGALLGGLPETIGDVGGANAGRAGGSIDATDSVAASVIQMVGSKTLRLDKVNLVNATNAELSGKTIYFSGMYRIA